MSASSDYSQEVKKKSGKILINKIKWVKTDILKCETIKHFYNGI